MTTKEWASSIHGFSFQPLSVQLKDERYKGLDIIRAFVRAQILAVGKFVVDEYVFKVMTSSFSAVPEKSHPSQVLAGEFPQVPLSAGRRSGGEGV